MTRLPGGWTCYDGALYTVNAPVVNRGSPSDEAVSGRVPCRKETLLSDREDASEETEAGPYAELPPSAAEATGLPPEDLPPPARTVDATLSVTVPGDSPVADAQRTRPERPGAVATELAAWACGACALTLVNRFIGLLAPLPPSTTFLSHVLALVYLAALLFALMQLTRAAARLPASTPTLLLLGLIFAAPMGVVLLVRQMDVPPPMWLFLTANNLFLPIGAALAGAAIGRIVRHPNTLLAAAGFAIFFDIIVVTMGTVAALTQAQSSIIAAVSVGAGPTAPMSRRSYPILSSVTIGPADILFMALFFASVWMLRLSWRATAAWMYGLLMAALVVVELQLLPDWLPGIPALVPMGIAILVANWPHRAFTAQEKRDLRIGSAFALVCAVGIILGSRTLVRANPAPLGIQMQRIPTGEHALVVGVQSGSRAEKSGIRPGDIVLSLNGKRVARMAPAEFDEAIGKARERGVRMVVLRPGGATRELTFGAPGEPDTPGRPLAQPPQKAPEGNTDDPDAPAGARDGRAAN